ncbi:uncharacterized protein LY89DRAFT_89504 [Mollisia scopiformis]|uniref:DUF7071 domain-containing protein n=1 Tax=Mollisia scopiformis TaxID=149040 RepID=A0A194X613_MOLSC|nr:uncharacterized protein LY89DRAFT_89504 [Mollisia scopiformis]KUJ15613.1 hypothetical protein LY89DRAFT_89504 [Mollisia scopiformis]
MSSTLRRSTRQFHSRFDPVWDCPQYAPNQAPRYEASTRDQREAEDMARDILGEGLFEAPTVKIILKLQGARTAPFEWQAIRRALEIDEGAFTDIARLCFLLPQPQSEQSSRENKEDEIETGATGHLKDSLVQERGESRRHDWGRQTKRKYNWET